jgi:molecular chaperone DnaK
VTKTVEITREDFEDLTSSLLSRTRDIAEGVLEAASMGWSDVDRQLLAGGSTRMPMVRTMMEEISGKTAERSINPDEVVALGAAVQAHLLEAEQGAANLPVPLLGGRPITVKDVTSQGLGILARDEETRKQRNFFLIEANTRIPAKCTKRFQTVVDSQTELHVEVTQGNDDDPKYVKVVGDELLRIPPYPAGAPVDVTFAYDIDQTVFIEVTDVTAERSLGTFEVNNMSNMDGQERDLATDKIRILEVS